MPSFKPKTLGGRRGSKSRSSTGQFDVKQAAAPVMDRAFDVALRCQQAGMPEQAKQLYIRILQQQPNHALALYNVGIIARESGDLDLALHLAERALAQEPDRAEFHVSVATALEAAEQHERADAAFRAALRLNPDCVDALYNHGNALQGQGNYQEAIRCFQRVLALEPAHPCVLNNLGSVYLACIRYDEAAAVFEQVVAAHPTEFKAYANLANVLRQKQDWAGAEAAMRTAIQLNPEEPLLRSNLAEIWMATGRLGEAIQLVEDTIAKTPRVAELYTCLAGAYRRQGRLDEALDLYRRALALEPRLAATHESALFVMHCSPMLSPRALADEHRRWAERHAVPLCRTARTHANDRAPDRTLRVGYVSYDLREHPVGYFMRPVLAAHDPEQVEVVCYAGAKSDAWTERIRPHASLWKTMDGLGNAELAHLIEEDRIDILVDLAGFTAHNRLLAFARKPAPVQVSWLGYFNTTGMRAMDYLIVDSQIAPPEEEAPFVEEPLRIPGCYLTYEIPPDAPAVAPPPCQERGFVTYGCFNNLSKIGKHVVPVWAEILRHNSSARLVLKNHNLADDASRRFYWRQFEQCGIAPERVDLLGPSPRAELLAFYSQIDIALDPFPYNGGTTSCEALAMGVPVITLRGDRFVSRVGSTILHNGNLADCIAHTPAEYIDKAAEMGCNPERLAEMRTGMRTRLAASTLCDTVGFTRRLESAYRQIWQHWCLARREA